MLDKKDLKDIKGIVKNVVDDSLDNFAVIVKDGFDSVDKKFEQATKERKALKRDMEEVKMKFAYTAWQIDMEEVKGRLTKIEQKIKVKK